VLLEGEGTGGGIAGDISRFLFDRGHSSYKFNFYHYYKYMRDKHEV
jgi:hypothetical protein